jgi:NhaP-type Na+/H+ or K+/H+ antiporter
MPGMPHAPGAAFTVSLALATGVVAQALAIHLRVPGIVLLLVLGVLLGPEFAGVVRPETLGSGLSTLVGFAVAVILFEGGMNLDLRRLRREQVAIRRLVTLGAVVTFVGGALAARILLGWSWTNSLLFGSLVIVTGPTVITPLLRRIHASRPLRTILEAEGVLIDAVGAMVAIVSLEIALRPSGVSAAMGVLDLVLRLGVGAAVGIIGGLLVAEALRLASLIPEGLQNVFALVMAMLVYQVSDRLMAESGIAAAIAAGMVVGNRRTPVQRELLEFKEQLTSMFIGMLFVLLAADLRLADVRALGTPAIWTVLVLMLVVRPLGVALSTRGTDLTVRERAFLAWMGPRGIVAAAVASLFAETLTEAGLPGGDSLRAMVFLVIAATVVLQGLSGGLVARLLGVRRPPERGFVILGAGPLGRAIGQSLAGEGEEVLMLDADPSVVGSAEAAGHKVVLGNALEESTLRRCNLETRRAFVAMTENEGINFIVARNVRELFRLRTVLAAFDRRRVGLQSSVAREHGLRVAFGLARDLEYWSNLCRRDGAVTSRFRLQGPPRQPDVRGQASGADELLAAWLPVAYRRGRTVRLIDERWQPRHGDVITMLLAAERSERARELLAQAGWREVAGAAAAAA